MSTNVVIVGVGGQGTVLASKLISDAAMAAGLPVEAAETIGMAQRGGSVMSHVRIGEGVHSPLVGDGRADLLISFEPAEAVRRLSFLSPAGVVVVANRPVVPVSAMTGGPAYDLSAVMDFLRGSVSAERLHVVDAETVERDLGSAKCLNVVLLGAAVRAGALELSEDDVASAIRHRVPMRFWGLNMRALAYAANL